MFNEVCKTCASFARLLASFMVDIIAMGFSCNIVAGLQVAGCTFYRSCYSGFMSKSTAMSDTASAQRLAMWIADAWNRIAPPMTQRCVPLCFAMLDTPRRSSTTGRGGAVFHCLRSDHK